MLVIGSIPNSRRWRVIAASTAAATPELALSRGNCVYVWAAAPVAVMMMVMARSMTDDGDG